MELPKRKRIRLEGYDYSTPGAYFVTFCTAKRKPLLWDDAVGAATCRPLPRLSAIGKITEEGICGIVDHYGAVSVDKYCIMPDHIHMILVIHTDADGRQIAAPTVSTVIGHLKRWVSMQVGYSVWQKSYVDRVIRNENGYRKVWEYIENNPIKLDFAYDNIDFTDI